MKVCRKISMALCLALIACLVVPAVLPAKLGGELPAQAASKVRLNKTRATIYNGDTLKLKVSGTSSTVKWSSSDRTVAKVSSKGVVTAKKVGKVTITAKAGQKKLECAVTVKAPLSVSASKVTLKAGKSKKITLTWHLTGRVSYQYDNACVISCSLGDFKNHKATFTIKALRPGTSRITFTNSKTADKYVLKVTVKENSSSEPIVDKTDVSMAKGKSATVKVTWPCETNPSVSYDPSIVDINWGKWNGSGWPLVIKGLIKGSTEVVIHKGEDGPEVATIKVTVK